MSRLPAEVRPSFIRLLIPALLLLITGTVCTSVVDAQSTVPAITVGKTLNAMVGTDASGHSAMIDSANDIVFDSAGNLYFTDFDNNVIRKVDPSGKMTTIAGNGQQGYSGNNGPAINAELNGPGGIAIDSQGNLYFADTNNERVRKIDAATGIITTVVGNGTKGYSGDGSPAVLAELSDPLSIAVDSAGDIYIADTENYRVRKVTASTGVISTVAGNGTEGDTGDGGPATDAEISPLAVALDNAGNLYISNSPNYNSTSAETSVREVNASTGIISTVAGNGTQGYSGDGGPATQAQLDVPIGLAFDTAGNLYIADVVNNAAREVDISTGIISTVAGNGGGGFSIGTATGSALQTPSRVAFDPLSGNMYIAAGGYIRTMGAAPPTLTLQTMPVGTTARPTIVPIDINATTTISSIAVPVSEGGKQEYKIVDTGCAINTALQAGKVCDVAVAFTPLYPGERPAPLVVTSSSGTFHFGMEGLGTGPQVALTPGTVTTVAGNGSKGFNGNGGPATGAEFYAPGSLAVDSAGDLYISDNGNGQVRKVDAATGIVTNVGGPPTSLLPTMATPAGIALDAAGNLYIADQFPSVIRKVSADTGEMTIVAGNGTSGFSGDGGLATSAELNNPIGVAVDAAGNLYIGDSGNNRIREVAAATGIITTIAGNGTQGYTGDGGPATQAELYGPAALALDSSRNIYFTDAFLTNAPGADVRKIDASTGIITTVAGTGNPGYSGDGGPATDAELNCPSGIALDSAGDLYIADFGNYVIREVSAATGTIRTIAGNGVLGNSGDGGAANKAAMIPLSVALDSAGNVYFSNSYQGQGESFNTVRKIDVAAGQLDFAGTPLGQTSGDSPQTGTISDIGNGTANTDDGTVGPFRGLLLGSNAQLQILVPKVGFNPSISNGDFKLEQTGSCPQLSPGTPAAFFPLNPGESCTLQVSFTPTLVGLDTGTVTIVDNAPGSPHLFLLSGTGLCVGTGPCNGTGGGTGGITGDFTLTASPSNEAVSSGSTATYTVTASGTNGFTGTVALTATGLPPGMTLDFSQTNLTVSGTPANSTLTIATTPSKARIASGNPFPSEGGLTDLLRYGFLLLPLTLFGVVRFRKRLRGLRRSSVLTVLIVLLSLGALAAGLSGCANIGLEPTTQTYNLTVTGVSGNRQHSVPLTLNVSTYKEIKY